MREVRRVFEPACGSGRLLVRLGRSGFEVSGCDLNRHAVEYCNARLSRHGLPPCAKSARYPRNSVCRPRVDAAFNMIGSFQHLLTEQSALRHLRSMAASLAPGGVYIIGLQLLPLLGRAACVRTMVGPPWLPLRDSARLDEANRPEAAPGMVCDQYFRCDAETPHQNQ